MQEKNLTRGLSTSEKEVVCEHNFKALGPVYHINTPENHPIIFKTGEDFKRCISIIGLVTKSCSKSIRLLSFEVMSNHLHLVAAGHGASVREYVGKILLLINRCFSEPGAMVNLSLDNVHINLADRLEAARNFICYTNRNGAVIDPNTTPFSYPWGANRYFFNSADSKRLLDLIGKPASMTYRRSVSRSRAFDELNGLKVMDGYICALSFCDIDAAEALFRDAHHYFTKCSRHIETYREIATLIGETLYYTDDDLYSIVYSVAYERYQSRNLPQLPAQAKMELAKLMYYDYNANSKQICRMLHLDVRIMEQIFSR